MCSLLHSNFCLSAAYRYSKDMPCASTRLDAVYIVAEFKLPESSNYLFQTRIAKFSHLRTVCNLHYQTRGVLRLTHFSSAALFTT